MTAPIFDIASFFLSSNNCSWEDLDGHCVPDPDNETEIESETDTDEVTEDDYNKPDKDDSDTVIEVQKLRFCSWPSGWAQIGQQSSF